uniref:Pentatricopeptide repeat-containing protein n=1 Tax=Ananas comosus var. bracteatus TaxID=296719 RepID=A0A6V7NH76_ANACO|nr:unnamed protein product [Ananas comosus var. bracteatus]
MNSRHYCYLIFQKLLREKVAFLLLYTTVALVSKLPNDKEVIYGALDRWTAWATEFPVIATAKALEILRRRNQWLRIIQVTKWLLSKGQVLTMETYDTLLVAFNMEGRIDEAESIWKYL